jgi:hypothetical protein
MIRALALGFAGVVAAGLGAVICVTATPVLPAAVGGGVLVIVGLSAATWAVGL